MFLSVPLVLHSHRWKHIIQILLRLANPWQGFPCAIVHLKVEALRNSRLEVQSLWWLPWRPQKRLRANHDFVRLVIGGRRYSLAAKACLQVDQQTCLFVILILRHEDVNKLDCLHQFFLSLNVVTVLDQKILQELVCEVWQRFLLLKNQLAILLVNVIIANVLQLILDMLRSILLKFDHPVVDPRPEVCVWRLPTSHDDASVFFFPAGM